MLSPPGLERAASPASPTQSTPSFAPEAPTRGCRRRAPSRASACASASAKTRHRPRPQRRQARQPQLQPQQPALAPQPQRAAHAAQPRDQRRRALPLERSFARVARAAPLTTTKIASILLFAVRSALVLSLGVGNPKRGHCESRASVHTCCTLEGPRKSAPSPPALTRAHARCSWVARATSAVEAESACAAMSGLREMNSLISASVRSCTSKGLGGAGVPMSRE